MAKQMMDIGLDANDDLDVITGDFTVVESTYQHQRQLLLNGKGSFKENPTICIGIFEYLDDEALHELARAASIEFSRDGMQINKIKILSTGKLNIDAYYP